MAILDTTSWPSTARGRASGNPSTTLLMDLTHDRTVRQQIRSGFTTIDESGEGFPTVVLRRVVLDDEAGAVVGLRLCFRRLLDSQD